MKDFTLSELSDPIREFLATVERERGALIRDQEGQPILNIIRCRQASDDERATALKDLERIQERIGDRLHTLACDRSGIRSGRSTR